MLAMLFKEAYFSCGFISRPMQGLRRPTKTRARARLTDKDVEYIYSNADQKLKNFIDLALTTAQRPADVLSLAKKIQAGELKDADTVTLTQQKTKHVLELQVGSGLKQLLSNTGQFPTSVDMASRAFTKIARGIHKEHGPTLYELRSYAIAKAESQGLDAQALAGHTNIQQTKVYLNGHTKVFKTLTR
jgi:integrase